jgi:hypothetical protein
MAEDKPLPGELPAPALKEAQHRVLRVQAANDRFGAPVITRQTNPGMTHFHPLSRFGWRRSMAGMGQGPTKSPIVCLALDSRHWGLKNYERKLGL